ncbi:uncharacterized protein LOC114361727 [Ostrinia furnacalis]|uniref:uncharacterized protein LOC114361727 n=1 Tax=Ostrinia furnacalis TaxID=93504 RepID=UPI00103A63E5|nr:uncharacterized protein LOC114361727 [Ostrinia furnacalis]
MRRYAKMSKEEELNRIYENMNTKYKFYIKKSEVDSISKLMQLANDYENVTADRQTSFIQREPRNDHHETSTNFNQEHKETTSYIHNYNTNTCCWSCGKHGHSMKDCRSKKILFCNGCGRIGKMSKQCCKKTSEYTQSMTINTSPQLKDNRPFVDVSILGEKYQALVDTGATRSYINDQVYSKFVKRNLKPKTVSITASMTDGNTTRIKEALDLQINIKGKIINHQVLYHPQITSILIGMDILNRIGAKIEWPKDSTKQGEQVGTTSRKTTEANIVPTYEMAEIPTSKKKHKIKLVHELELAHEKPIKKKDYSRNPKNQEVINKHVTRLKQKTKEDWIQKKIQEIQKTGNKDYEMSNGKLYRKIINHAYGPRTEKSSDWKLCINNNEKDQILKENHDTPTAGHLGTAKTLNKISQRYYWPGMYRDVSTYVKNCKTCQVNNARKTWSVVSIDQNRPLPRSSNRFTDWTEILDVDTVDHPQDLDWRESGPGEEPTRAEDQTRRRPGRKKRRGQIQNQLNKASNIYS